MHPNLCTQIYAFRVGLGAFLPFGKGWLHQILYQILSGHTPNICESYIKRRDIVGAYGLK